MAGSKKWVYLFNEGNKEMRDLLGGKGCNLAEMTNAGLPVPYGFTITTEACNEFIRLGNKWPEGCWEQALEALKAVEEKVGKKLGDPKNPLLVSVRSGARISMPGMMDTVLNLGLNDETVEGLAALTNNPRFAYDSYRRFIMMFGDIVLQIERTKFDKIFDAKKEEKGVELDTELDADDLKDIVAKFKALYKEETGSDFPMEPIEQLKMAAEAVFGSWMNPRAITYRKLEGIPDDLGTAVNVQMMVYGNMGDDSGTGVAFTRNPSTGERKLYGEFLQNAQGEDVVAGVRTPVPIAELEKIMPDVYKQFTEVAERLEKHYRDMQDMEFTIERGKLYMLQTRTGKRTGRAAVKIAVDMVNEGLIDKRTAVMRVTPSQLDQLLHKRIDEDQAGEVIAKGLPASPGAAQGKVIFDSNEAAEVGQEEPVILVRPETSPDDIAGLHAAQGTLTSRGGMTSHAAVVARGMGRPAVVGCEALDIDMDNEVVTVKASGVTFKKGDIITIDGSTGNVYLGAVPLIDPEMTEDFATLLSWADEIRTLGVRANADTPEDAKVAFDFGAEGVGLCRTEHMFMGEERLPVVQGMIMADGPEERAQFLEQLLPMQRGDFEGIFKAMEGRPVIIRLLDPPLHEFLPDEVELVEQITELRCKNPGDPKLADLEKVLARVRALKEFNPMLGLRGCRLGITMPDVNEMQVKAIISAACRVKKEGLPVKVEIMIPLVGTVNELKHVRSKLEEVAKATMAEEGVEVEYMFGTMIEIPRAALTAGKIAEYAEFFSFGTNDLTQTTWGYSRDDAEGKFIHKYLEEGILEQDPFQVLDSEGVGRLMQIAKEEGQATRPELEVGICGEHGGEPKSIAFCNKIGLNYVSCSPYRVPIARLAAAQAAIEQEG